MISNTDRSWTKSRTLTPIVALSRMLRLLMGQSASMCLPGLMRLVVSLCSIQRACKDVSTHRSTPSIPLMPSCPRGPPQCPTPSRLAAPLLYDMGIPLSDLWQNASGEGLNSTGLYGRGDYDWGSNGGGGSLGYGPFVNAVAPHSDPGSFAYGQPAQQTGQLTPYDGTGGLAQFWGPQNCQFCRWNN